MMKPPNPEKLREWKQRSAANALKARKSSVKRAKSLKSACEPQFRGLAGLGRSESDKPQGTYGAGNGLLRKRKGFRSVTRDRADHYFSLFIRYRDNWTCQRCGGRYEPITASLQCSHFYGRARENTRFDPVNADSQCAGCHNFLGANPELHREWKLQRIGEKAYTMLRVRAESRCKKDRKLMALICKKLYEDEKARYESSQPT